MIKVAGRQRTVRETTADFEFEEDGELKRESIRVRYFSPTITELREFEEEIKAKFRKDSDDGEAKTYYLTELLTRRISSLPDLADAKGKPHKITLEFIESLDVKNLERIRDAINDDLSPKSQPA